MNESNDSWHSWSATEEKKIDTLKIESITESFNSMSGKDKNYWIVDNFMQLSTKLNEIIDHLNGEK